MLSIANGHRSLTAASDREDAECAEPAVAADGAAISAFRAMKFLQPAPLLNCIVMPKEPLMHPFIEKMVRHVQNTPPSCLSGFRVLPLISEPWNDWAGWSLTCSWGASKGKVLGYPSKDYDPEYKMYR